MFSKPKGLLLVVIIFSLFFGIKVKNAFAFNPPQITDATINGTDLVITFDQNLNSGTVVVPGDLRVTGSHVGTCHVSSASISGDNQIIATTDCTFTDLDGAQVNLEYTKNSGWIQDDTNSQTDSFTFSANNNSPDTTPPSLQSAKVDFDKLTLAYSENLNSGSIPSVTDFVFSKNGATSSVSAVSISDNNLVLTVSSPVISTDSNVRISYIKGTSTIQDLVGNEAAPFVAYSVTNLSNIGVGCGITTGTYYSSLTDGKIYISRTTQNDIAVVDRHTNNILKTIPLVGSPTFSVLLLSKLYVANGASTVSVLSTTSDVLLSNITTPGSPVALASLGNNIYIANSGTHLVSVIDALNDTITTNINVGLNPSALRVVGNKIYVSNLASSTISVINTNTKTVSATINVGTQPFNSTLVGTKLYVLNINSKTVSVIDTVTDTLLNTINIGDSIFYATSAGGKVYLPSSNGKIIIINTSNDSVSRVVVGGSQLGLYYPTVIGTKLYVSDSNDNNVTVMDLANNNATSSIYVGAHQQNMTAFGSNLYLSSGSEEILDTISASAPYCGNPPNLRSFTSTSLSGAYSAGQNINITANFDQNITNGSMTVLLNSGASVVLNTANNNSLSGIYTIGSNDSTPDLAVSSVINGSVTDIDGSTRTNYSLYPVPSSVGNLVAENSMIARNVGDSKDIVIGSYEAIPVGTNPYQVSGAVSVGSSTYTYVANQGSNNVSVINTNTNTVVATISVGSEPYGLATLSLGGDTYVYVANIGSNNVKVIRASDNSVVSTINVGVHPYYVAALGTNIYVTNGLSNTVSVIDANTNLVTATIPVGVYPRGIKAHGTDLYVANFGDENYGGGNTVSVIDSLTNTVRDTIVLPLGAGGPRGVAVSGNFIYVANYRSNTVSVIDTANDSVVANVNVEAGPRGVVALNGNVYVENFDAGTISVINTSNNTVTKTIVVGHSPSGMGIVGNYIYVSRFQDNVVSILDTVNGVLHSTDFSTPVVSSSSNNDAGGGVAGGGNVSITYQNNNVPIANASSSMALSIKKGFRFSRNLSLKSVGEDVVNLQKFLNLNGFRVSINGPGSMNHETNFFGPATQAALAKFQKANGIKPTVGYFGPITRGYVNNKIVGLGL